MRQERLETRSFKAFAAMFDNYNAYVNREERLGTHEMAEINELLDAILETKCMKIALLYINNYLGENFTVETFREKLFRMWFYLHTLKLKPGKVPRAMRMRRLRFEAASRDKNKYEIQLDQRKAEYAQVQKKFAAFLAEKQLHPENADPETEARLIAAVEEAQKSIDKTAEALAAAIKLMEESQDTSDTPVETSSEDAKEGVIDYCSGFEHVFMGEIQIQANESIGHVLGYHSWLKFYFDERAHLIDYLGTKFSKNSIANAGAPFMCVKFRWDQDGLVFVKERGSFFVGCSPEFSIAVATVCFFETETPERIERCGWEAKADDRFMRLRLIDGFKFDYYICKDKEYLVSCFEELIGVCEERRVRKRVQKLNSEPIVRKPKVKKEQSEWKRYCQENMRRLQAENPGLSDRDAYARLKSQFEELTRMASLGKTEEGNNSNPATNPATNPVTNPATNPESTPCSNLATTESNSNLASTSCSEANSTPENAGSETPAQKP